MGMPGFTAESSMYKSTGCYLRAPSVSSAIGDGLVSIAATKTCVVWGEGPDERVCFDDGGGGGDGGGGDGGGGVGAGIAACSDRCDNQNVDCGNRCDNISNPIASARCNANCDTILNRCLASC
jgi:hypothetical protein